VSDARVANITDVSVAGNPSTVRTTGDNDSTRIAATGMNTADTGAVTVATVTLEGESAGTTALDLTVAAVGNESGSAYDVTGTTDGELAVEGETTPTDDEGDSDSDGDTDSTDNGPTAVAHVPQDATAGTPVTFNASNSTSKTADGIESYEWTLINGTNINGSVVTDTYDGRVVTHTHDDPGTYRVVLTVTDSNGFDRDTTGIIVDAAPDDSQNDTDDTAETSGSSDDETDETGTPTVTTAETPNQTETTTGGSTQSPPMTATTTETTATEPGSLQLVPVAVIGGLVILVAGLIYYRRE